MWQKIKNAPWTPLLLFALLLSSLANLVALRKAQAKIEEWGWDHHYLQSESNRTLDVMNQSLSNMSESSATVAACSKQIRPVWCRQQ